MWDVLEQIGQGVVKFDSPRRLEAWNSRFKEMLRFPDGFLKTGLPHRDVTRFLAIRGDPGAGDPGRLSEQRFESHWDGTARRLTIVIDGGMTCEVLTNPTDDGGLVIVCTDVTGRERQLAKVDQQRAELAARNQYQNLLFSVIAHDLRSPFNLLLNASDLMSEFGDRLTPEQAAEFSAAISDAAATVFGLLDNLLEWTQVEMNGAPVVSEAIPLKPIVDAAMGTVAQTAKRRAVTVRDDTAELTVLAHPHAMGVVLRNLLANAIQHSASGSTVTINARRGDAGIEISVVDSGIGMTESKVAELLRDGDVRTRSGTGRERGTGLGFPLCRRFVERQGGSIRIESRPGRGTTVRATIPGASYPSNGPGTANPGPS